MSQRAYDGLVLDLDGTLLDPQGKVPARTREALRAAQAEGVRVMVATGRSSLSAHAILEELDLELPATVFNGAGLYCHRRERLLEERILSNSTLARALAFGREHDLLTVVMRAEDKLATEPHDDEERRALAWMSGLKLTPRGELEAAEYVVRVSFLSRAWPDSRSFAAALERHVDRPCYMTDFPLAVLDSHPGSRLHVIDLHPPCRGKAEALRYLSEELAVDPARVVAVGDATNDIPMFEVAGLAVCMGNGMAEARASAQRVIGGHDSEALAELVEELFLPGARQARSA